MAVMLKGLPEFISFKGRAGKIYHTRNLYEEHVVLVANAEKVL